MLIFLRTQKESLNCNSVDWLIKQLSWVTLYKGASASIVYEAISQKWSPKGSSNYVRNLKDSSKNILMMCGVMMMNAV